jgi:hypothetical protein
MKIGGLWYGVRGELYRLEGEGLRGWGELGDGDFMSGKKVVRS